MKTPAPKKLPSGAYRVQVMVDGKRVSITDADPKVAVAKAMSMKAKLAEASKAPPRITVGEAIDRYIESKDGVLSPSTVAGYKRLRKSALPDLMDVRLSDLTQERIQRAVNKMAKEKSPKYVHNAHGLLSATLAEFKPEMKLRTTLPQKQHYDILVPSDEDLVKIFRVAKGTEMELPILLAAWLGLRASEVRGITWDCINGDVLHIKQAIVQGENGPVLKGTKTYSGDRKLQLPPYILSLIEAIPKEREYLVPLSGATIYKRFSRICEKAGVPHFRFHDLRHSNASIMLALGVPDKYSMKRMGHATNNMLKTVYQHTFKSKEEEVADIVDSHFEELMSEI
ncbi:MAG: site-specific integrase [Oscillospiraceae bacterium]|nr:site-specific integrase [Oscillospiraceae bacterium]